MKSKQSSLRLKWVFKFLTFLWALEPSCEVVIFENFWFYVNSFRNSNQMFFRKNPSKCVLLQLMLSADSSAAISQDIGSELERWREKREYSTSMYFFWKSFWGKDHVTIFFQCGLTLCKGRSILRSPTQHYRQPWRALSDLFWKVGKLN